MSIEESFGMLCQCSLQKYLEITFTCVDKQSTDKVLLTQKRDKRYIRMNYQLEQTNDQYNGDSYNNDPSYNNDASYKNNDNYNNVDNYKKHDNYNNVDNYFNDDSYNKVDSYHNDASQNNNPKVNHLVSNFIKRDHYLFKNLYLASWIQKK